MHYISLNLIYGIHYSYYCVYGGGIVLMMFVAIIGVILDCDVWEFSWSMMMGL